MTDKNETTGNPNWKKGGVSPNPAGRPKGSGKGWQPYGLRAAYLWETVPPEDIFDLPARDLCIKYNNRDAAIIMQMRKILADNNGEERERLLSRIEGQARQTVDLNLSGEVQHDVDLTVLTKKERAAMRRALNKAMGRQSPLDAGDDEDDD